MFHYRLDGQQAAMSNSADGNSIGAGPPEEEEELHPESSQWAAEEEVHDEDQQMPRTTTTPIKERVKTTAPVNYQYNTEPYQNDTITLPVQYLYHTTISLPYYNHTSTIPVSYKNNTSTIL